MHIKLSNSNSYTQNQQNNSTVSQQNLVQNVQPKPPHSISSPNKIKRLFANRYAQNLFFLGLGYFVGKSNSKPAKSNQPLINTFVDGGALAFAIIITSGLFLIFSAITVYIITLPFQLVLKLLKDQAP